jgi:hypothetical protein
MKISDITSKFKKDINNWNRKMRGLATGANLYHLFPDGQNENDVMYFINNFDTIGEDYIKDLIKYGNDVIEKLQPITPFPHYTMYSREEQNKHLRIMGEAIKEVTFPIHKNKLLRGIGREMTNYYFPLGSIIPQHGPFVPPYTSWSTEIPSLAIERIRIYLDMFNSLIEYKEQEREQQRKKESPKRKKTQESPKSSRSNSRNMKKLNLKELTEENKKKTAALREKRLLSNNSGGTTKKQLRKNNKSRKL